MLPVAMNFFRLIKGYKVGTDRTERQEKLQDCKQRDLGPWVMEVTMFWTFVLVVSFRQAQPTILKSLI